MKFESCPRFMGWRNLKSDLKELRHPDFIKAGVDSGFPPCCIAYYKIRGFVMHLWVLVFGNYGFFVNPAYYYGYEGDSNMRRRVMPQHVLCWFHKIKYWGRDWTNAYHTCPTCDWMQFENKECKRCDAQSKQVC